jgi:hypothetical protein
VEQPAITVSPAASWRCALEDVHRAVERHFAPASRAIDFLLAMIQPLKNK